MNRSQLRKWQLEPILKDMGMYSQEAEDLLVLTDRQESGGLKVRQNGYKDMKGGAFSRFQIEMNTYDFIVGYAKRKAREGNSKYLELFNRYKNPHFSPEQNLLYFEAFATMVARLYYWTKPEPIPKRKDFKTEDDYIYALAKYYKKHWNTEKGDATIEQAVENYKKG